MSYIKKNLNINKLSLKTKKRFSVDEFKHHLKSMRVGEYIIYEGNGYSTANMAKRHILDKFEERIYKNIATSKTKRAIVRLK